MADGSLARRYARALVAIGRDSGTVDPIGEELEQFRAVLMLGDGELGSALSNPGISLAERRAVLEHVLPRLGLSEIVQNFLYLVLDKNRFDVLSAITREYQVMADEIAGRVRATVQTARPFSASEQATVQNALASATGKQVTITWHTDPSLIGGIVARLGDMVYDASVRARLDEIKQALINSPGEAIAEA